jgi:hypothetical protein
MEQAVTRAACPARPMATGMFKLSVTGGPRSGTNPEQMLAVG